MNAESQIDTPIARVPNFPAIYDGELLYSIVARYGSLLAYPDAGAVNLDLFGQPFGHAAARIPSGLGAMAARIPASLALTALEIARRHTLLPYYCAFFPPGLKARVVAAALSSKGRAQRVAGIDAKPLTAPRRLRFCPACLDGMAEDGHELHWKSIHQLAIVAICPEHGIDLRESQVSPSAHDRCLHPATRLNCPDAASPVIAPMPHLDREALLSLARGARTLLAGRFPANATPAKAGRLAELFRDLGYRRRGRLDWELLGPGVEAAAAGLLPLAPELTRAGRRDDGWFDHAMDPRRPARSDRVLITATIIDRIEAIEPRFWQALDRLTGEPFMRLDAAV